MSIATRTQSSPRVSTPKPRSRAQIHVRQIKQSVDDLMRRGLNPLQLKLHSKLIDELLDEFESWFESERREILSQLKKIPEHAKQNWLDERFELNDRRKPENQPLRLLTDFLFQFTQRQIQNLESLRHENGRFLRVIAKVRGQSEREKLILNYAAELGAEPSQIKQDARAFGRWFDEEAVMDRFFRRVGKTELLLIFTFNRLSEAIVHVFRLAYKYHGEESTDATNNEALRKRFSGIWKRLNIEGRVHEALVYDGDRRVHSAVLKCMASAIGMLPAGLGAELLDNRTLVFIRRASMETQSDVWIQCDALTALTKLSFPESVDFLRHRLEDPREGDDMFVRRHVLKLIEQHLADAQSKGRPRDFEIDKRWNDPSPFVRQKLASVAFLSTHRDARPIWKKLAAEDSVAQVRASALLAGVETNHDPVTTLWYLETLVERLEKESDAFAIRTAMHCAVQLLDRLDDFSLSGTEYSKSVSTGGNRSDERHGNASVGDRTHPDREFLKAVTSTYQNKIRPALVTIETTHPSTPVRRWASQSKEQVWARLDPDARRIIRKIRPKLMATRPGKSCHFSSRTFRGLDDQKLGRVFAVISQDDFGYDIHRSIFGHRIVRGQTLGFRLWRMIHECKNTATDKRQAIRHTVGRISTATLRAPSQILGELSETKVPGEPLTMAEDGTWRPFLPLPDDFISVLNLSWFSARTVKFFSSQGITYVTGPKSIFHQLKAAKKLNLKFAELATQRNWIDDGRPANDYIAEMRKLGFEIRFERYSNARSNSQNAEAKSDTANDKTVEQFFASTIPLAPLLGDTTSATFWKYAQEYADYFGSAFENSLEQLVIFAGAILLFAIGKHLYANLSFRKSRQKIPLTIGGWGTRGKSGTERLKAALIGELGHGLVSKTTGCEAMFIHVDPLGEPLEVPLFRPYDKATIWEQRNLIRMASRLHPSVFLWECMALTPAYVDVLQRQWTQDDLGTITNTYPDHEDVQGPAGYNVAQTISGFVPLNSKLISSEQVMRPYVTESCRSANTSFRGVGWLESGLITEDVLDRFPYKEHPDNIALVVAMGEELGCDYEFSLKSMADSLVPDLGVLKTHPKSHVRTRQIEFTNGMSANERFGCMGNWRRLGFDAQDPWESPDVWISGVVNNRADRVPRSRVFAKIMVDDINADRFFLIGNNLKGLLGFVEEAWSEKAEALKLRDKNGKWNPKHALAVLNRAARDFRQPIHQEHIQAKLFAIGKAVSIFGNAKSDKLDETLRGLWNQPKAVESKLRESEIPKQLQESAIHHHQLWLNSKQEYDQLQQRIKSASASEVSQVETEFIAVLKTWFDRKIVVVDNYDATGEEIVSTVVDETPPGFLNRTMGLQNIKGTGLDFVYRFQAWDMCFEACQLARAKTLQSVQKGLQALVAMPTIGQLCEEEVQSVVRQGKNHYLYRRPEIQALVESLERKLNPQLEGHRSTTSFEPNEQFTRNAFSRTELNRWMLECAEQFLDVHDSIRRRDKADRIYKDLAEERISRQRAVVELRKLNKRQKGGWLSGV